MPFHPVGKVIYKDKVYGVLEYLMTEEDIDKIIKFKKEHDCIFFAEYFYCDNIFTWLIDDDKLFLKSFYIRCPKFEGKNLTKEIFHSDRVFLKNITMDVRLLKNKKRIRCEDREGEEYYYEANLIVLSFENGILLDVKNKKSKSKCSKIARYFE